MRFWTALYFAVTSISTAGLEGLKPLGIIYTLTRTHRHTDTQTHRHTDTCTNTDRHRRRPTCTRAHTHTWSGVERPPQFRRLHRTSWQPGDCHDTPLRRSRYGQHNNGWDRGNDGGNQPEPHHVRRRSNALECLCAFVMLIVRASALLFAMLLWSQ